MVVRNCVLRRDAEGDQWVREDRRTNGRKLGGKSEGCSWMWRRALYVSSALSGKRGSGTIRHARCGRGDLKRCASRRVQVLGPRLRCAGDVRALSLCAMSDSVAPGRSEENSAATAAKDLVQYVVIRRDLLDETFQWPLGSVISQGVHAAAAALIAFHADSDTALYRTQLHGVRIYRAESSRAQPDCELNSGESATRAAESSQMRTVTLEVKNEAALKKLANKLSEAQIEYVEWIEMPEQLSTALATKPASKSRLHPYFKSLRLFK
mmetsp:Transcript_4332/g.11859  ORF Transcript_4332/g.11859 Transcript_4332/m.11859 type:complete len:266 (-) Transcript_4332:2869-3666(-)